MIIVKCYNTSLGKFIKLGMSSYMYHQYHPINTATSVGRPRFDISRDLLLYLMSLSFKWTEIAALLNISRMTLYRYVVSI